MPVFKLYLFIVCVCHTTHTEVRGKLQESVLASHEFWGQNLSDRVCGRHLYCHLRGSILLFYFSQDFHVGWPQLHYVAKGTL